MKKGKIVLFIFVLILIDLISKQLIVSLLKDNTLLIFNDFLKFIYVKNYGAAFGLMSGNTILLIIISLIFIFYIIKEMKNNNKIMLIPYSLILSGALGNLIDRIIRGYVVDFISFTLFKKDMAVFNIADSYITIGVIILLLLVFKENINGNSSK